MLRAAIFGPPTAGKSTLSFRAAACLGVAQIAVGQLLREARAESGLRRGTPLADGLVAELVGRELSRAGDGYLLDGYPRSPKQMAAFLRLSQAEGCRYLLLDLPLSQVRDRYLRRAVCPDCRRADYGEGRRPCPLCGRPLVLRPDANEEALESKLEAFRTREEPLLLQLATMDRLERVPVLGEVERDLATLLRTLDVAPIPATQDGAEGAAR